MAQDLERVYTINLGKVLLSQSQHRAVRAINMIREFARHHMKVEEIKIEEELAHQVWARGVRSPPRKIRVRMSTTDDGYVLVSAYNEEADTGAAPAQEDDQAAAGPAQEPDTGAAPAQEAEGQEAAMESQAVAEPAKDDEGKTKEAKPGHGADPQAVAEPPGASKADEAGVVDDTPEPPKETRAKAEDGKGPAKGPGDNADPEPGGSKAKDGQEPPKEPKD